MIICKKCGIEKPLSEYHFEKNRNQYRTQCKDCRNATRRKHYPKVKDKLNERARDRSANEPGYAEKKREAARKTREKYKDIWNANQRERYANDPVYREEQKQKQRDLWANSPEHRRRSRETNIKWIENNRERYDASTAKYYQENKERIKEYAKQYREENPEHCKELRKAQYDKHQETRIGDQRKLRKERKQHLLERLGGKCVGCGVTENLQFDHINPEEKSFTITPKLTSSIEVLYEEVDKCQLLCSDCHLEKTKEDYLNGRIHR